MRLAPVLLATIVFAAMPLAMGCLDDPIHAPPYTPTPIDPPDAAPVPTVRPDAAAPVDAAIDAPVIELDASGPITSHGSIGPGGVVASSPNYKLITSTNEGIRNISTSPNYKFNGGALNDKR